VKVDENPRLKTIPTAKLAKLSREVGPPETAPWPPIEGCLTALCTARSGSTLLCRQLETLFDIGEMGESLNWSKLKRKGRSARRTVAARTAPWFAYKITMANLLALELTGFVDAYIDRTMFIHLIRRDIVAQAVSRARASQTGQWHAGRKPAADPVYDADLIAHSVKSVASHVSHMSRYIESTGRPHTRILYEDIATPGLPAARAAGDMLGLPRREDDGDGALLRPIEKMGDEINEAWKARFLTTMDASIGAVIEAYVDLVDAEGSAA
jgi:LPS sulfotransferase NodH